MKNEDEILEVWATLRDALRKLRGQNQFRGNEEHLIELRQIRLYQEPRAGHLSSTVFIIHLTARMDDLWAERFPGKEVLRVNEFDGGWLAWLTAIVDACRGAHYAHTNSSTADYRRAETPKT